MSAAENSPRSGSAVPDRVGTADRDPQIDVAATSPDDLSLVAQLFAAGQRQDISSDVVMDVLLEALKSGRRVEDVVSDADLLSRRQRESLQHLLRDHSHGSMQRRSTIDHGRLGDTQQVEHASVDVAAIQEAARQKAARSDAMADNQTVDGTLALTDATEHARFQAECAEHLPLGAERYHEAEEIGRGGWGVVVRAVDRQLERDVAVKKLGPQARYQPEISQRFLHEARITAQLQHPGIVPVYERGVDLQTRQPFYAMKLLEGVTLRDVIAEYHAMPSGAEKRQKFQTLLSAFVDVCQAIAYAHSRGIIHRDLKPSNVVIGQFGETIVVDWGLAREVDVPDEEESLADEATVRAGTPGIRRAELSSSRLSGMLDPVVTQQGSVIGTPSYMAPEQARGAREEIDHRSDIYALGAILYVVLTGQSPFQAEDVHSLLKLVLAGGVPHPHSVNRQIPAPLASICLKAMSRERGDRYQTADDLIADINRFLASEHVSAHQDTFTERIGRWCRRHPTATATTTAATLILLVASTISTAVISKAHREEIQAKEAATAAHASELIARQESETAHARTLVLLEDSRRVADTWLIGLSGTLERYPGMQPVRDDLISKARTYYSELFEAGQNDQHLQLETARCLLRLGDLHLLTEDLSAARQCFHRASEMIDDHQARVRVSGQLNPDVKQASDIPSARDSATPTAAILRERLNAQLGIALCDIHEGAFAVATAATLQQALRDMEEHPSVDPDEFEHQHTIARGYLIVARGFDSLNDSAQAVETREQALRWATRLNRKVDAVRADHLQTVIREELAADYTALGRARDAGRVLREQISTVTENLETDLTRPDLLETRALTEMRWAGIQRQFGEDWLAEEAYRHAVEDLSSAWHLLFGDRFYSENLAIAQANLGQMALRLNRLDEAEASLRDAVNQLTGLVQDGQGDRETVSRMAECNVSLGDVLVQRGDSAALPQIQRSIDIFEYMAREGIVTDSDLMAHGRALMNLSRAQNLAGRTSESLESLREAVQHFENIASATRDNSESRSKDVMQRLQATARLLLSDQLHAVGDMPAATREYVTAIDQLTALAAAESSESRLHPDSATRLLIQAMLECGDSQMNVSAAEHLLKQLEDSAGHHSDVHQLAAITAYRNSSYDMASHRLQQAIRQRRFPDSVDTAVQGCIAAQMGDSVHAQDCLKRVDLAAEEQPGNLRLCYWHAQLQQLLQPKESATALPRQAE
ncbi:MAG: serine/threonine protein kinase [Planctomycetaceae bacterium]|nr:serine/threonine protein kinase [Planctomycetaceae bacterium]